MHPTPPFGEDQRRLTARRDHIRRTCTNAHSINSGIKGAIITIFLQTVVPERRLCGARIALGRAVYRTDRPC